MEIGQLISEYGFPVVMSVGLGYFIYYIWVWATTKIKPILNSSTQTLIELVDRVRMLDNDMIRLETKLNMILEYKEEYEKMTGKKLDIDLDDIDRVLKKKAKST